MPVYTVKNLSNDEYAEVNMPYDEFKKLLEDNEHLKQVFKMPATVSSSMAAHRRAGSGWQDVLKNIKKNSGKNNSINV
jgi:hypothetical protein